MKMSSNKSIPCAPLHCKFRKGLSLVLSIFNHPHSETTEASTRDKYTCVSAKINLPLPLTFTLPYALSFCIDEPWEPRTIAVKTRTTIWRELLPRYQGSLFQKLMERATMNMAIASSTAGPDILAARNLNFCFIRILALQYSAVAFPYSVSSGFMPRVNLNSQESVAWWYSSIEFSRVNGTH